MMSEKKEKLLILGHSGSGKTFLFKKLLKKGLRAGVKSTTRPARSKEEEGIDYYFKSKEEYFKLLNEDKLVTNEVFEVNPVNKEPETWYYGITKKEFKESQIFILTPGEFKQLKLSESERKECFVVFLDIPRKVRESRLHHREDKNDSVKRRLDADEIDFKDFNDYDLKITDPDFGADDIYELMD
jgi:guanylate kinase